MELTDRALVAALAEGLPLSERPYAEIGRTVGLSEEQVIARLSALIESGTIRRFGIIVRHHELGIAANAMAVWDIPDDDVAAIGRDLASSRKVTLCYRRPRCLPDWPYNLFCMVHGRDRTTVEAIIADLVREHRLAGFDQRILFSTRRFKQCGAAYGRKG